MRICKSLALCVAVVISFGSAAVRGQVNGTWLQTGTAPLSTQFSYSQASNWTSDPFVPSQGGTATFADVNGGAIGVSNNYVLNRLTFNSSTRTLFLGGQFSLLSGVIDSDHLRRNGWHRPEQ